LFLTPLRPRDVMIGKSAAQLLRLAGLWLAAIPLMSVPLLLGGLRGQDILHALVGEVSVGLAGVAAGLMATSLCERWGRAVFTALVWGVAIYGLLAVVGTTTFFVCWHQLNPTPFNSEILVITPFLPLMVWVGEPLVGAVPRAMKVIPPIDIVTSGLWSLWFMAGTAFGAFLAACSWTFWVLRRLQTRPTAPAPIRPASPAVPAAETQSRATLPAASPPRSARLDANPETVTFGRWTWLGASTLGWLRAPDCGFDSNPAYWRERCGLLPRLGLWLAPVTLLLASWITYRVFLGYHLHSAEWLAFAWLTPPALWLTAVFYSAGSFRTEHEEGTLELLLCTPLSPRALVFARIRNLVIIIGPSLATAFFLLGADQLAGSSWNPFLWDPQALGDHSVWLFGQCVAELCLPALWYWVHRGPPEKRPARRMALAMWFVALLLQGLIWRPLHSQGGSRWESEAAELQDYLLWSSACGLTAFLVALHASARRRHPLLGVILGIGGGCVLPALVTKLFLEFLLAEWVGMDDFENRNKLTSLALGFILAATSFYSVRRTLRILTERSFHPGMRSSWRWFGR
jgi:hypothetical protein